MNATTFRTGETSKGEAPNDFFDGQFLSSRIGVRLSEQHCPSCNSIVYSRRHSRCGVCEQELPKNFLFNRAEAEKVDGLLMAERQRHKAWLMKNGGCNEFTA
jgi:hypothetical protein